MQSIDVMVFTGHNWKAGPLEPMGCDREPIRVFASMQYQLLLKLEITETLISSKKSEKKCIRRDQVKEIN